MKTHTGGVVSLGVKGSDTIGDVKSRIPGKGIIPDQHGLIYHGKLLDEDCSISDCNILKESTLHLVQCEMKIYLKTLAGKTVTLDVKPSDTIWEVKSKFQGKVGWPPDHQIFVFAGKQLNDDQTIADYDIQRDSIVHLVFRHMDVCVKAFTGETITLKVQGSDTIQNVKSMIQNKLPSELSSLGLTYAGKELQDGTLSNYNIQKDSTLELHMVFDIHVKIDTAMVMVCGVKASDTIKELKYKIYNLKGFQPDQQILNYAGKNLDDGCTLSDCDIYETSTLQLYLMSRKMKIYANVHAASDKVITLEVASSSTILEVKSLLYEKEGILPNQQTVIFSGRLLEDDYTLSYYNVQKECTLHLMFKPIKLCVKTASGSSIDLTLYAYNSIEDLKLKIQDELRIPIKRQKLFFADTLLENNRTLCDYNIQEYIFSTLNLEVVLQVSIKTLTDKIINLDVVETETIKSLKHKIHVKEGIPSHQQRLIYSGKKLEDSCTFLDYNIPGDAFLYLVSSVGIDEGMAGDSKLCSKAYSNSLGEAALIQACQTSDMKSVRILLDDGVQVDTQTYDGSTPLMIACDNESPVQQKIIQLLLERGARIELQNRIGQFPLLIATTNNNRELVRLLLSKKADINMQNGQGFSPLIMAVMLGYRSLVELLIDHRSKINLQDKDGKSALIHAVSNKYVDLALYLVEVGAEVDLQDNEGLSPLMHAMKIESFEIVQCLVAHGASLHLKNFTGKSVFNFCPSYFTGHGIIQELVSASYTHPYYSNTLALILWG